MSCFCDQELEVCQCRAIIDGQLLADSPLTLMRSRYVAFCLSEAEYLFNTSSTELKKTLTIKDLKDSADTANFIKLEIIESNDHFVEFKAFYLENSYLSCLHERSEFIMEDGSWKYHNGALMEAPDIEIKRNDVCPCGSGKKYKKCHLLK